MNPIKFYDYFVVDHNENKSLYMTSLSKDSETIAEMKSWRWVKDIIVVERELVIDLEKAEYYQYHGCSESAVMLRTKTTTIVIFYDGNCGIHIGDDALYDKYVADFHTTSSFMFRTVLRYIATGLQKDFEDVSALIELDKKIGQEATDLSKDEISVINAVVKHIGVMPANIWKSFDQNIYFDVWFEERKLNKLVYNDLIPWATSRRSKIKFDVVYYDYGGSYPGGFSASW